MTHGVGLRHRAGSRTWSLAAALSAAIAGPLPILLAGTLAVQLREDIGLDAQALGLVVTAYFLCSSSLSVAAGRATDRLGWRRALRLGAIGSAACLALVALLADGVVAFAVLLAVGSIGHALAGPSGNLALSQEMPLHRHGLLFGIKQSANPLAGMFAGAAVPVLALSLGWRSAFGLALVFPVVAWVGASQGRGKGRSVRRVAPRSRPGARAALPRLPLVAFAVTGGLASVGASSIGTFAVLTVVQGGVSPGVAGLYVLVGAFLGMLVRIMSGWWVDHHGGGGLRPVAAMLLAGAVSYVMLATGRPGLALPAVVLAYTGGWGWPGLFMFAIARHYGTATGRATGIVQIGLMLGGALSPLAFGSVVAAAGYGAAWGGIAAITLLGAGVSLYAAMALEAQPVSG